MKTAITNVFCAVFVAIAAILLFDWVAEKELQDAYTATATYSANRVAKLARQYSSLPQAYHHKVPALQNLANELASARSTKIFPLSLIFLVISGLAMIWAYISGFVVAASFDEKIT